MSSKVTSEVVTRFSQRPLDNHIFNRREATSRLYRLSPGTEEHCKLQEALTRTGGIVEISLSTTTYKVDISSEDSLLVGGFGSSEHVAIGEAVKLQGLSQKNPPLLFVGGIISVRFGHIIALAGDFYGVPEQAISLPGGTSNEKTARFEAAFDTLDKADPHELRKVMMEIDQECLAINHSGLPHHCYSSHMIEKNKAIKKIKDNVDALLINNSDHFSTEAWDAYSVGHTLARIKAREAGKHKSLEGLKRAYALDAFACHFLTDLFASGHIRNQRGDLETFLISQFRFSKKQAELLAGILTGAQHEKDGNEGLNVSNKKGEQWRAFGDGSYLLPKNDKNRAQVIAATQQSVDEIYDAFSHPDSSSLSAMDQLIPHPTPYNPPPLYSIKDGKSLFLHQGSDTIKITKWQEYLNKGVLQQALKYLPEEYIYGFISGFLAPLQIEIPPIVDKVIIPQVERLTGSIWHMVGLATYYQNKQDHRELNEKIDEAAGILKATFKNSEEILQTLRKVNSQLNELVNQFAWTQSFQEIQSSIAIIEDLAHQEKIYNATLSEGQRIEAEKQLWGAHLRMSRVFGAGTTNGREMLAAYTTLLAANQPPLAPLEIKIAVTLWFRQMLDYQVQAVSLYASSLAMRNAFQANEIAQISLFESSLTQQLESNKEYIHEALIYESQSYIALQLEKSKTKRFAFSYLNKPI